MTHRHSRSQARSRTPTSMRVGIVALLCWLALVRAGAAHADGSFAVMSYNVKGLPEIPFVTDNRTDQMYDIAERLEDFHTPAPPYAGIPSIVGLQEVFTSDYYDILTNPETVSYAWITERDRSGGFNTGDGLVILSDFAVDGLTRTTWEMCNGSLTEDGSDCDTPKGYTFAEVTLEAGATFHLYTLHADAGQGLEDQAARRSNINQLVEAIASNSPEGTAVVVLGDTNSRYTRVGTDNIQNLLTQNGLRDVWVELRRGGIAPGAGPAIKDDCETTPSTADCELVDKIFYRDGDDLVFVPHSYEVLREMFMGTQKPLSDHDPVAVSFAYALTVPEDRPCGDPVPDASGPALDGSEPRSVTASDALFVLRAAVGGTDCPPCVCDVNGSATVSATDALIVLRVSVGQALSLDCPVCEGL